MWKNIVCAVLGIALLTGSASSEAAVRLHVIGETDLYEDQAFKLLLKDELLRELDEFTDAASLEEGLNKFAREHHHAENIRVEAGVFRFPDQPLEGKIIPGGAYPALRVRIGKGEGRNWWSLLYPSSVSKDMDDAVCYSALIEWLMALLEK